MSNDLQLQALDVDELWLREWAARGIAAMEHTLAKYAAFEEYLRNQADPESEDGDDRPDA